MLIDYIYFPRLLRKIKYKEEILQYVKDVLPRPYNIDVKFSEQRNPDYFDKNGINKETYIQNTFGDKVFNSYYNKNLFYSAGEAAVYFGYDVFESFSKIDDFVYSGMSNLAGENLDSLADLSSRAEGYAHSNWSGWSDALVNKVGGHIGEVYAADHLGDMGLDVAWPETSNNQGWDLLVNGHEMNIKIVNDYSNLSEHFQTNPDIPVIIPGDTAHIPDSAIHFNSLHSADDLGNLLSAGKEHLVLVDDSLNGADIMDHTEAASDAMIGSPEMVQFHIPWITLAFSGHREIVLLFKKKTDLKSSAKNIGLDLLGTSTGGFIGAKGGALAGGTIGTIMCGPVGAAVGGAIGAVAGGIGGAVFGRKTTNSIKTKPFKDAFTKFQNAESLIQSKAIEISSKSNQILQSNIKTAQSKLNQKLTQKKKEVEYAINRLNNNIMNSQYLTNEEINLLLTNAQDEIGNIMKMLETDEKLTMKSVINPDIEILGKEKAIITLKKAKRTLKKYFRKIESRKITKANVYRVIAGFGICRKTLIADIRKTEKQRVEDERIAQISIKNATNEMFTNRKRAMEKISSKITDLTKNIQMKMLPFITEAKILCETATHEGQKIGLI